ncbi:MAG: hypothetical protein NW200_11980 [Hyphomonadaceae bacterium]|nr:hypothetical protein [Hyphomonadaceae bacterium]
MNIGKQARAFALALALGVAACGGGGSNIASPGATDPGTPPGGGSGGGTGGGTGGGSATCPTGTTNQGALGSLTVCQLTGAITSNLTLPRVTNVAYRLNGRVDVGIDLGGSGSQAGGAAATLTIEPGVTVYGASGADYLVVNRGSRLIADGTATDPIVFTSQSDLNGTVDPANSISQWGGLVILGRAPIRNCNAGVAQGAVDCQAAIEGVTPTALYGGATANDNSGKLEYVQVRFAGFPLPGTAGNELNGITFGGVGSGTEVSYIQVHNNADDGVEFFGGTVSVKYLVLTGNDDDSLDYDTGWTGNLQFVVIRQRNGAGDNLVEASNLQASGLPGTLNTNPTISNFTFIGTPTRGTTNLNGILLNASGGTPGSSGRFFNGIVTGSTNCLNVTAANTNPAPTFNSILFDCPGAYAAAATTAINAGTNNSTATPNTLGGFFPGPNELARTAVNPTTLGPFFSAANYIGAFSPTENATNSWASGWTYRLFGSSGCPTHPQVATGSPLNGQTRCTISGTIATNLRLPAGNLYQLVGRVNVGADIGTAGSGGPTAVLTVDPGVTIFGSSGSDYLVVNRGSQIFVNGTRAAPVIMTSLNDLTNAQIDSANAIGEWGGLVILGRAPIRNCNAGVAQGAVDCQAAIEGVTPTALYGGNIAADNSGRLEYLQVKFAGFPLPGTAGNELNGITFGGVGSGTSVNYIQAHNNADDGVEYFGGTVNGKYIVLTGNDDDSLDYDTGYVGNLQFIISRQRTGAGDNLVEASNLQASGLAGTLNTNPAIANFTFVGTPTRGATLLNGILLNASGGSPGSSGRYVNGIVTGSTTCLNVTAANTNPAPTFNSILFDCPGAYAAAATTAINAGANNSTATANTLTGGFINGTAESARTAVNPTSVSSTFTATTYIGAVRDSGDNWWRTWTCGLEAATPC